MKAAKKIAVITGASSGLGADFASEIDRYHNLDEIWLVARRKDRLTELAGRLKKNCVVLPLDLTNENDLEKFRKKLVKETPDIRYLVNNAGYGAIGPVYEIDTEFQIKMIDLNVRALTALTLYAIPFLSRGSRIIQVASSAGFAPMANFAVYAATKSYVLNFSQAIAEELKSRGITVNIVCPGPVRTEFFEAAGQEKTPGFAYKSIDVVRHALRRTHQGRTLSVYGLPIKLYQWLQPLIPNKLILIATRLTKKK